MIPTLRIPDTANLTKTTLGWMNALILSRSDLPELVEFARDLVVGAETPLQEAEAVRLWLHENIVYRRDPVQTQYLQDPLHTLQIRSGNCDCQATLCGALLAALGHAVTPLGVIWTGRTLATHAILYDATAGAYVDTMNPEGLPVWPPQGMSVAGYVDAGSIGFRTLPDFSQPLQGFLGAMLSPNDNTSGGGYRVPTPILNPLPVPPPPTGGTVNPTQPVTPPTNDQTITPGPTQPTNPAPVPAQTSPTVTIGQNSQDPGADAQSGTDQSLQPGPQVAVPATSRPWLPILLGAAVLALLVRR